MEKFMLNSELANKLYTEYAKDIPIYDYHCHLDPKEIYEDKEFSNISKIWLNGDHYKWRAMRANGIREEYITGDKTDYEKFYAWASTLDKCILNPLYHWNALELKRYFNIDEILTSKNANVIWDAVNSIKYSPRKLIEISNVNTCLLYTSDAADE